MLGYLIFEMLLRYDSMSLRSLDRVASGHLELHRLRESLFPYRRVSLASEGPRRTFETKKCFIRAVLISITPRITN